MRKSNTLNRYAISIHLNICRNDTSDDADENFQFIKRYNLDGLS